MLNVNRDNRRIGMTQLPNGGIVSTVFLNLDHRFDGEGDPIVFESMCFSDSDDWQEEDCDRYCTYEEAVEGHRAMVEKHGGKVSSKDMFDEDDDLFEI